MRSYNRRSLRRTIHNYEQGLNTLQRKVGDTVVWYEFDFANSTTSDIYDEGALPNPFDSSAPDPTPGRVYKPGKTIPAIWIRFQPPTTIGDESGEYTVNTVSVRITSDTMRRMGLQNPYDPSAHYNDRFSYNGFLYRVEDYAPKGWLHGYYLMVDATGIQVKEEELYEDQPTFSEPNIAATPWTPGQQLSWPPTQPSDWEDTQT